MQIADPVLTRSFEGDGKVVLLEIFAPLPDPDPSFDADPASPQWRCRYRLTCAGEKMIDRSAVGIDSLQSLLLAIAAAKADFRQGAMAITWLGQADDGLRIDEFQ